MVGAIHEAVSAKAEASPTQPGGYLPDYARQDIAPTISLQIFRSVNFDSRDLFLILIRDFRSLECREYLRA